MGSKQWDFSAPPTLETVQKAWDIFNNHGSCEAIPCDGCPFRINNKAGSCQSSGDDDTHNVAFVIGYLCHHNIIK